MRTLDDIIPPSRRKQEGQPLAPEEQAPRLRSSSRFPYATALIALLIVAASAGVLMYFSSARVEITPNTVSVATQGSFTAGKNPGMIPFQVISVKKDASQEVPSTGTKTVRSFASGSLTVYNTQNKPQRLIASTRFASASGRVFRIHAPLVIPAGTPTKPGTVVTTVYADQPGDTYNIGPSSFTVPGLAGTPQETQVYARSFANMEGGASGPVPVVSPAAAKSAQDALKASLAPTLSSALAAQVPQGYVLLSGAATTTYRTLAGSLSQSGAALVKEEGTATAVVFPNTAIASAIASSAPSLSYHNEPLTLATTTGLNIRLASAGFPDANVASFVFTLAGTAPLAYSVDPARIISAVAGQTRSAALVALSSYPEVKRAVIILRPFWRQTLPQDPAAISVVVKR